jgi:predicted nucleic acid-binding protein
MSGYLLDTNVMSELRKPRPHGAVMEWLRSQPDEDLFVSAVTVGEIQAGIELTRKQDEDKAAEIERWLDLVVASYSVVPMDGACFREWARLMRGHPEHKSHDAMIAATARVHGLTVATRERKDFSRFGVEVLNPFDSR